MNQPTGAFSYLRGLGQRHANLSRERISEHLEKFSAAAHEISKKIFKPEDVSVRLLTLDRARNPEMRISALVVCQQLKWVKNDQRIAAHVYLLEDTALERQPRTESFGAQQYPVKYVTTDYWDKNLQELVLNAIRQDAGTSNIFLLDAEVVPADFNFEDKYLVEQTVINGFFATNTFLETHSPGQTPPISIVNAQNDATLQSQISFDRTPLVNTIGRPVRADVKIRMTATPVNQRPGQDGVVSDVGMLGGYFDIDYVADFQPPQPQNPYAYYGALPQPPVKPRRANFVITYVDCRLQSTLEGMMLMIVQSVMLGQNRLWYNAFKSKRTDGVDMYDIGAIGYEIPHRDETSGALVPGSYIDTKADSFRDEDFFALMNMVFDDAITVSVDISEAGPETPFLAPIMAAALGDERARKVLVAALDRLTGNRFSEAYKRNNGTGQLVFCPNLRTYLGTYKAAGGELRDIRDIGYLALLVKNGGKNMRTVAEYTDSLYAQNQPLTYRESVRAQILENSASDVRLEGRAARCIFEPALLNALAEACSAAGLSLRPNLSQVQGVSPYERAVAPYSTAGFALSTNASQLFQSAGAPRVAPAMTYSGVSRWDV